MRITLVQGFVALLAFAIWTQQPARSQAPSAPPETKVVTSAELAGIIAKQPAERNSSQTFIRLAPYNVNMEHRITGQTAAVHERDAELFYVLDGAGTIVTGGKLVDEKRINNANLSGTSIQGGVPRRISKGDFVMVPEGVPHQFPSVEGNLTLMSLHLPRADSSK